MPLSSAIEVTIIDGAPVQYVPSLRIPLVMGLTAGKSAKDQLIVGSSMSAFEPYFDATDPEYIALERIFAQPRHAPVAYAYNVTRFDYKVATATTGTSGTNNVILWTAETRGPLGDNVEVELKDPGAYSSTLDVDTETKLITGTEASNNAILWTSKKGYKDIIKVEYVDPGTQNAPLSIGVVSTEMTTYDDGSYEHVITVNLATDGTSTVTTTAGDIISAITADADASALVTAQNSGTSDGTGVVANMTETPIPYRVKVWLGTDATGAISSTATEVINAVNTDVSSDAVKLLRASNYLTSTGADIVAAETKGLDRNNTDDSPSELTRILDAIWKYVNRHEIDWPYFLVCTSHDDIDGDREELSDAVATRLMIYMTSNNDAEAPYPDEIHDLANTMASDRTGIIAHTTADDERPEAALVGLWSGHENGNFVTMWKTLNTIPAAKYSEAAEALLEGQAPGSAGAFTYVKLFGASLTTGDFGTDGSFLDWRWDKDWLALHLKLAIINLERSVPKLLGDYRGIALLKATVREVLNQAVEMGILAKDEESGKGIFYLDFPDIYEWATLDQNRRHYRIARAVVKPANAIDRVTLNVYATNEMAVFLGAKLGE